jgi:hypothetical protein
MLGFKTCIVVDNKKMASIVMTTPLLDIKVDVGLAHYYTVFVPLP